MEEKQIKIEYASIYYCMATASGRTNRVEGGDIILSINGNALYTTPDAPSSFTNADSFFSEFVVPRIDAATAPRTLRVIRFFRKVGGPTNKGRYVAPRDAKLNHSDATFIFESNLTPIATFNVGDAETDNEEDIRISNAREAGATNVVFDVIFKDQESMGINLWSNVLMWQSSLGATDNRPVIQTGTKRVLPSSMAGTAPAPPPFMRAAMSAGNSSGVKESPARRVTESPAITPQKATSQPSVGSVSQSLVHNIDNSTMFTEFVDPLLARHSTSGKGREEPKRLPKPSETAGSAPAPPPFIRRAGFPSNTGNPSEGTSTLRRLQYAGKTPELSSIAEPSSSPPLQTPSGLSDFDDSDDVTFSTTPVVATLTTPTPTPTLMVASSPPSSLISPPSSLISPPSSLISPPSTLPVFNEFSESSAVDTGSSNKPPSSATYSSSPAMREARKLFSDGASPTPPSISIPIKKTKEPVNKRFNLLWFLIVPVVLVVIVMIMKDDPNLHAMIDTTMKTCKELIYGKPPPPPPPPPSNVEKLLSYFGIKDKPT